MSIEQAHDFSNNTVEPVLPVGNTEQQVTEQTDITSDLVELEYAKSESRAKKWLMRSAMGALVVGGAVTLATNSMDEVKGDVLDAAPWAAGGLATTEALWVAGAALSLTAAGKRVTIRPGFKSNYRAQMAEVTDEVLESKAFKAGLYTNTVGAVGSAALIGAAAVTSLPPETWPGALGLAGLDIAGTFALRAPLYKGVKERSSVQEKDKTSVSVRKATLDDMDRLAEIDLDSYDSSYGENPPTKDEIIAMMTQRWQNAPGWMYVAEKNGQVEGFATAFRTNKSAEEFVSWEESTNNGTLEGKVNPKGNYVYVANLTINRDADAKGAKDMLLANLFANAISEGGIEYGYFESRMPGFQEWVEAESKSYSNGEELSALAKEYADTRREDGKRMDWQLRMYEGDGFKLGEPVADAFDDEPSLNFGVVCTAAIPANNMFMQKVAPARWALATTLRQVAKSPKLLKKVL